MPDLTPAQRSWLLGEVSTDTARRVLTLLTCHTGACTAAFLAGSAAVDLPETRRILVNAVNLGLVTYHHDDTTDTMRYTITAAGRDHLTRPPAPPGSTYEQVEIIDDPLPAIDDDASAITVNDQPSSTPMTGPGRRGRPTWCTPGHGVCIACKEGS